jgi:hypothetical protein
MGGSPNLDSVSWITLKVDRDRALLEGPLERAVARSLEDVPRLHPGLKLISYRIHPSRVEFLLDLSHSDEDLSRLIQAFKRRVHSSTGLREPLWNWSFEEIQGADPEGLESLLSAWKDEIALLSR